MSILAQLTPLNYLEEKAKFLADTSFNPQFIYEEPVGVDILTKYGLPQNKYLDLAKEILDKAYFNRNEADLRMMEGSLISEQEVNDRFEWFLKTHRLENRLKIEWSSSFISRASVTSEKIKLKNGVEYRDLDLTGLIYHEVGTHVLRRVNYEQQPWFKKKKKFGLTTDYLRTEEGLATLHSLLPRNNKSAYNTAIRYLACQKAQQGSFLDVWNFVGRYLQDAETRWMVTFKMKRGISDTSQPGGYTKEIVYFEGAIQVWKWLMEHQANLPVLYKGKIAVEDIAAVQNFQENFELIVPSFYINAPDQYADKIFKIGDENNFQELF